MTLFDELRQTGVAHTAAVAVGSIVKISQVQVIIEGPHKDGVNQGMWRGVLVDAPMAKIYGEDILFLQLDDGRHGKIKIMRVDPGFTYFQGMDPLFIPRPPEEEEEEMLKILDEIHRGQPES